MIMSEETKKIIDDWIDKFLESFCIEVVEQAKANIRSSGRDRKGNIAKAITWEKISDGEYIVKCDKEYASYLEYGTQSHDIFPKVAKVLHWTTDGKHFFSKGHRVSGITPTPFMEPAYLLALKKAKNKEL